MATGSSHHRRQEDELQAQVEVELDYNPGGLISYKPPKFYINGKDYHEALAAENPFSRVLDEALQELEKAESVCDFASDPEFFRECGKDSKFMDRGFLSPEEMMRVQRANKLQKIKRSMGAMTRKLNLNAFVRR